MLIRSLVTRLGFDLDETGAKAAEKQFSGLIQGAASLVALVTAAGAAIVAMVKSASDLGDRAAKTGTKLGITAEEVQELSYAADNAGVEFGQLAAGLKHMQRNADEAKRGSKEAAAGFGLVGVRVRDASGAVKPTITLFQEVADKIKDVQDPARRTAIAMRIFGKSGQELIPLLNEGAAGIEAMRRRAHLLGAVMDNQTAAAAEDLDDAFTDLGLIVKGVGLQFAIAFMPTVKEVIDLLVQNDDLIKRIVKTVGKWTKAIASLLSGLLKLGKFYDEHHVFLKTFAVTTLTLLIFKYRALGFAAVKAAAAATLAWIKAAAPLLAILAIAALIALAVEDVYYFVTGGQSAIGNLRNAFLEEARKPNAHWIVKTIAAIIDAIGSAIEAVDFFFKGFFEEAGEIGGIGNALIENLKYAIKWWANAVLGLGKSLVDTLINAFKEVINSWINQWMAFGRLIEKALPEPLRVLLRGASMRIEQFLRSDDRVGLRNVGQRIQESLGFPEAPRVPLVTSSAGGSETSIVVEGAKVDVSVTSNGTVSPQAIGGAAATGVNQAMQRAGSEIASRFRGKH